MFENNAGNNSTNAQLLVKYGNQKYLIIEFFALFLILPALYLFELPFHKIIPLIFLFAYCSAILIFNKEITWKPQLVANWKIITLRFTGISLLILLFIGVYSDLPLWADFDRNKKLFIMVLVYPFLSAFPQELIFRKFFFYRYALLFRHPAVLLIINVLLFSFAHIYFGNWIVTFFTLIGGAIFALTYRNTRSLFIVTIEHSFYGLLILSSGLSEHFYKAF